MATLTNFEYIYKIIIVGDSGIGKSNVVDRFINGKFNDDIKSTIGIDFQLKAIISGPDKIKLQIWDSAGQERYRSICRNYYRQAGGILIMFDLTRKSTFDNVPRWITEIKENVDNIYELEIMLVGNKADLEDQREVSNYDIIKLQEEYDLPYIETSAKSELNVNTTFTELVQRVHRHKRYIHCTKYPEEDVSDIVTLIENDKQTGCNCIIL